MASQRASHTSTSNAEPQRQQQQQKQNTNQPPKINYVCKHKALQDTQKDNSYIQNIDKEPKVQEVCVCVQPLNVQIVV